LQHIYYVTLYCITKQPNKSTVKLCYTILRQCTCLGDGNNKWSKIVACSFVVLHVFAITFWEGVTQPAPAIHCLRARFQLFLQTYTFFCSQNRILDKALSHTRTHTHTHSVSALAPSLIVCNIHLHVCTIPLFNDFASRCVCARTKHDVCAHSIHDVIPLCIDHADVHAF